MKSVMIVFNQANTGRIEYMLDVLGIKGFTFCVITVVEDEQLPTLLESIKKLDLRNEEVGVRAFVWNIEATV